MSDKFINSSGLQTIINWIKNKLAGKQDTLSDATDSTAGIVKTNSSESVTLNANGQLDIGGRLGQMSDTTGIYSPKTINPAYIGNGSFLLTEASGTKLGNKSLAVSTGSSITLKTSAAAGATQYVVTNSYENRIICAGLVGGTIALNEATAAENYATVTSVTINGSSYTPSSTSYTTGNIIIKTDKSVNPSTSTTSIRPYTNEGYSSGFSNLFVGQMVGGVGGASTVVGQKVYSASGNACNIVGASIYNTGNGNAIFGRQHISRKNRCLIAGTGHDTTNAKSESVVALGEWSDVQSDTVLAIGDGTSATARHNVFEIKTTGDIYHEDVSLLTKNISISITTSSGSLDSYTCKRCGGVVSLAIKISATAAVSSGGDIYKGTISTTSIRPATIVSGCGFTGARSIIGVINSEGVITIRNASATSFSSGSGANLSFTWLIE